MALPHACHPKENCLEEPQCHEEHSGNSPRCLYSINLPHISIAGAGVVISSHVLPWRGHAAERSAGVEHLILTGMDHGRSASHKAPSLLRKGRLKNVWAAECRGGKPTARMTWQVEVAAFEMQMDLSSPRCPRAWQTLHSLVCDRLAPRCRERNKLKAQRRCSLFK